MIYFNYHACVKKLLSQNKLYGWYFADEYNGIRPALILLFHDIAHPIMPVRAHRWKDYLDLLPENLFLEKAPTL